VRGSAIVLLALGCAGMRVPEVRPTGGISGVVVDAASGAPLADALVIVRGPGRALSPPTISGDKGDFLLAPLPPGAHDFVVERAGYKPATASHVPVEGGFYSTVTVNLRADPAATDREAALVPPVFLSGPDPHYPSLIVPVEGQVLVRCVITTAGLVRDCIPDANPTAVGPIIDELQARRYRPALRDGEPFEVCYTFRLDLRTSGFW